MVALGIRLVPETMVDDDEVDANLIDLPQEDG